MSGADARPIDAEWRRGHPLPPVGAGLDKEGRGLVLVAGGSRFVPGALRLTGEAVLRAGAGKVRLATVEPIADLLAVHFPEAAMMALPADAEGEIAGAAATRLAERLSRCDTLLVGPGMLERPQTPELVAALLEAVDDEATVLLDAGAMTALRHVPEAARALGGRVVLTPHPGELARLIDADAAAIAADPAGHARRAAGHFGAVVALKSTRTVIATPGGALLGYCSEAPGLGTAGSGDVLAGVVAGLLARGAAPEVATAWGVWLHGEAGKLVGAQTGAVGYLARELLPAVPALMAAQSQR